MMEPIWICVCGREVPGECISCICGRTEDESDEEKKDNMFTDIRVGNH